VIHNLGTPETPYSSPPLHPLSFLV
jgi:hypothetical protein